MRYIVVPAALILFCVAVAAQQPAAPAPAAPQPVAPAAPAPEPVEHKLKCPLDGFEFPWPDLEPAASGVGFDSDLCTYPYGVASPARIAITCPHCNYTDFVTSFADTALDAPAKDKILAALVHSPYRGVENSWLLIPSWERYRLGELCAKARGLNASAIVDFPIAAIYAVRVHSTRLASGAEPFGDPPLRNPAYFARVETKMRDEANAAKRAQMKLELAMFAQRMGLPDLREKWLLDAEKDPATTPALKRSIDDFRSLIKVEISFQKDALVLIDQALAEKDLTEAKKTFFSYFKADTLRRLGNLKDAAVLFNDLRQTLTQPSQERQLIEYYCTLLQGQLPPKGDEKKTEVKTPEPTKTDKK